ncbi:MAG TPA: hypothetical protein PLL69_05775 [Gemmatimonadales bacterium]|nr:hypothetical protein [Gemmatimonadales bacterium]
MKRPSIVAALAATLILPGCGAEDLSTTGLPAGEARLAILNALPEGAIGTLLLDGDAITLPELGARSSRSIPEGVHRLEARSPSGLVAATVSFAVGDGSRRAAILGGTAEPAGAEILISADTASIPVGDAAKVRLVHTVEGTPQLEGWLTSGAISSDNSARLVSPFTYGMGLSQESPGYVVRPSGHYRVQVTRLSDGAALAETMLTLDTGQVWSVVLTRDAAGQLGLVAIRER